jgi:hypothetical protein
MRINQRLRGNFTTDENVQDLTYYNYQIIASKKSSDKAYFIMFDYFFHAKISLGQKD